jgi:hypothetical protein
MIKTYYQISGIKYKKTSGVFDVLSSKEKGVVVGTVRMIAGELLYCSQVDYGYDPVIWTKPIVDWRLVSVAQLPDDEKNMIRNKILSSNFTQN